MSDAVEPVDAIPVLRRFHVRMTVASSTIVLLAVALGGAAFYQRGVAAEIDALRSRLAALGTVLAGGLDADGLAAIATTSDPVYVATLARFQRLGEVDPDVQTVYVLCATEEPGILRARVDWSRVEAIAAVGDRYDARELPVMLRGLTEPAVEDRIFTDAFGGSLSGYVPIAASDGTRCVLGLDVGAARVDAARHAVLVLTAQVFGLAFLFVLAASIAVGRTIRGALAVVITASHAIAQGRFGVRVELRRNDEFGLLGRRFNSMAEGLAERELLRETFGRYVSEDVARALLADGRAPRLGGEERVVTVLFCDLRGYSTIAEHLAPTEIVELLNAWLGAMNEVLDAHQGVVIEYLGDAIFAVFGAPCDLPGHPERAVRCAVAMRERMVALNAQPGLARHWKRAGIDTLATRTGLHMGRVVAGNLGSPQRMKYGVTGDAVNIASRLEALNKELGTEILASDDVRAALPADLAARMTDRGEHHVRGREALVRVWSI